ncbi:glutathione S-transferase kappa 1-like [Oratosquilla oratoria]|uniref:glutathione S-transferase kappa 1-like n=1 Tax=Oratosquilla oratoria TaxID=337810 RepID=UPI003F76F4FB
MFRALVHPGRSFCQMVGSKPKTKIEFFYDVISPFSWIAFEVLMRYKHRWNVDMVLKPMLLGGVRKAAENLPRIVTSIEMYKMKDLVRSAKYYGVPVNLVEDPLELLMVKGSLIPMRFLTAIDILYPEHLESASRALWMAVWNRDTDFTTIEILQHAGLEAGLKEEQLAKVREYMSAQFTKEKLKENTMQAVNYGAFGAPTIVAHVNEEPAMFFGSDRFHLLCQEIGEKWEGPYPEGNSSKL